MKPGEVKGLLGCQEMGEKGWIKKSGFASLQKICSRIISYSSYESELVAAEYYDDL